MIKCYFCNGTIGEEDRCIYCGRSTDITYELWVIDAQKKATGDTGMWVKKPSKRGKGFYDRREVKNANRKLSVGNV